LNDSRFKSKVCLLDFKYTRINRFSVLCQLLEEVKTLLASYQRLRTGQKQNN